MYAKLRKSRKFLKLFVHSFISDNLKPKIKTVDTAGV
jgi:hypothetical protein